MCKSSSYKRESILSRMGNKVFELLIKMFQFNYYEHVFGILFFVIMTLSFYAFWFMADASNPIS